MGILNSFAANANQIPDTLTVARLIELYLRHVAHNGSLCPAAIGYRKRTLEWFCSDYGDLPVEALRPFHLTDFVEGRPGWKAPATRRLHAAEIRAVFQWAFDLERIDRNPFRKIHYADSERRPDLPDDVLGRMIAVAGACFAPVLRFLRYTGCRIGELTAAKWQDVDLERGVWTIHRHKTRKRTGKPKVVALVPDAVALLRSVHSAWPEQYERPDYVFLNSRGGRWQTSIAQQRFAKLRIKLGIKGYGLHAIRHRWGTAAVAAGAPLKLVSKQMGHSSQMTTERFYVHLDGELDALRNAALLALPKSSTQLSTLG